MLQRVDKHMEYSNVVFGFRVYSCLIFFFYVYIFFFLSPYNLCNIKKKKISITKQTKHNGLMPGKLSFLMLLLFFFWYRMIRSLLNDQVKKVSI